MVEQLQQGSSAMEVARLRKALSRLQKLALKYREAEVIQKALFKISELASSARDMSDFYPAVHAIIADLMMAKNFFICIYDDSNDTFKFVYFVDEYDDAPSLEQFPAEILRQSLTGFIMRTGNPFLLSEENFEALVASGEIRDLGAAPEDWLGVPLHMGDSIVGAMVVQSYTEGITYTRADRELLQFVSQHIVTALERIRQREFMQTEIARQTASLRDINHDLELQIAERKRAEQVASVLFAISELTNTSESMDTFFAQLHQQVGKLMANDNFFVALLDEEQRTIEFAYYVDQFDQRLAVSRPLGRGMTEYVIRKQRPVFIDEDEFNRLVAANEVSGESKNYGTRPKQWMGSPLIVDEQVIGVLSVQTYSEHIKYKQDDLELLNFVSQHVAVAIERRRNADEVKRINSYLERKVAERTEELVTEIERRKKIEERLFYDAHHDSLTGLPNRAMFTERLQQALKQKRRFPNHSFAVLFVDLDRFKEINDTLGHSAGDEFLLEASRRIGECVRDNDTVARLGGDEFVILLNLIRHTDDARDIASRIIEKMRKPFVYGDSEHYSGASVGIAECTALDDSAERLLRDADAAMYQAKSMGRGRYVVFDQSIHKDLVASLNRETALRHAHFDQDFVIQHHDLVRLSDKTPEAREVLVRWQRGDALLPAQRFLSIAEKAGMIIALDQWLLTRCCELLSDGCEMPIYVSLSTKHLFKLADTKALLAIIDKAGIDPKRLVLEFSETELQDSSKRQLSCLRQLADAGVGLALNEFGRSAGALHYILNYPFTQVKLAARFVADIALSSRGYATMTHLVNLCKELNIDVCAAGITNKEQQLALQKGGVTIGQGTLYGEPQVVKLRSSAALTCSESALKSH